jgi:hypothetical protein
MAGRKRCISCKEIVKDKGIACSICNRWFHPECEDVSDSDYQLLQKSSLNIHIYCKACQGGADSLHKKMIALKKSFKNLESKVSEMEIKVNSLPNSDEVKRIARDEIDDAIEATIETKIEETIDSRIDGLHPNQPIPANMICSKVISEAKDRESRVLNVIMYGIPESAETDNDKRKEDDSKHVTAVLTEIEAHPSDQEQMQMRRLGKLEATKTRPILITVKEADTKKNILTNAKKLKKSQLYKGVGIAHDLTKCQREVLKNLQEEARKTSTPETKYIVIGNPDNWRVVQKKEKEQGETDT